ncbi:MAG TPA: histidine kinase dimerization/phosphoacceptor domain -containing protein [Microvirga sp.]|jgi:two-component sensor histidine kinase|nr:histidine kinase dimerization/phosphoacceptor domain -containing protein [Microvirga sp.]
MLFVRDVRGVLYAAALLFAVALLAIRSVSLWIEYRTALARAEATTHDMALILEEYAKRTFETSDLVLGNIARFTREKGGAEALRGKEDAHAYLVQLSRESSSGDFFLVVDRNGVPTALTAQHPAPNISLKDQRWFQAHVNGADRVVGEAIVGRITGEILFTYTRRLTDLTGAFDGAVQVAIRPTFLQEVTRGSGEAGEIGREVRLALFSSQGSIVARTGLRPEQVGQRVDHSRLFSDLLAARTGTFHDVSPVDGADQIVSFRRLERYPLVVSASIPRASALAGWVQSLVWSVIALAVVFAGLGWLTLTGVRLSRREEQARAELEAVNGKLGAANRDLDQANRQLTRALADKVALLQEIHHRVKNNLSVTSSLLRMQARRFADPQVKLAFQETEDRLRSVALIHEALYRSDAAGSVQLDAYLERLVAEVARAHGAAERAIAVKVEAEPIAVDLDRAVPLALAVTEAITNAFKHAFEEGQAGAITVSAQDQGSCFEVVVRDTGRGRPVRDEAARPASLGTRLIDAFATQLQGLVTYENDNGAVFRISVPHKAASSP